MTRIVINILLAGKINYRDQAQGKYEWVVKCKAHQEEKERQRKIEEQRKQHELIEQQNKERLNNLLADAKAIQDAETIRNYVQHIQARSSEYNSSS